MARFDFTNLPHQFFIDKNQEKNDAMRDDRQRSHV